MAFITIFLSPSPNFQTPVSEVSEAVSDAPIDEPAAADEPEEPAADDGQDGSDLAAKHRQDLADLDD